MSIAIGGFDFDGPNRLVTWIPPHEAGIYTLLRRTTAEGGEAYTPVYLDQCDDLCACDFTAADRHFFCSAKEAGAPENLYIAVYYMPGATRFTRQLFMDALLAEYHPACNYEREWTDWDRPVLHEDGHSHHLSLRGLHH
jgi:hypothetical protein